MRSLVQALILGLVTLSGCGAADAPLREGEQGRVTTVETADRLKLESGLTVRLAGVAAPVERQAARESRAALAELAEGETVRLRYGGPARDRYGRAVAQLYTGEDPPLWLQGALVEQGWLLAESVAVDTSEARRLMRLEAEARRQARGHWGDGVFVVRGPQPNALAQQLDTFQLVQGIVVEAAQVGDWTYLNFGLDYRTDFTVALHEDAMDRFKAAGIDPMALEGAKLRVRGWLEPRNGPMITVDHPEQVEVLD